MSYYDNSHLCFECNGRGCRQCQGSGVERFPLSVSVNECVPPMIQQAYGDANHQRIDYKKHRTQKNLQ